MAVVVTKVVRGFRLCSGGRLDGMCHNNVLKRGMREDDYH
jgi:hypothetical protein